MAKEITYTKAFTELQKIIGEIESSMISIDEMDGKIKRASELIKICRNKLYRTEKNIQEALDEINNNNE